MARAIETFCFIPVDILLPSTFLKSSICNQSKINSIRDFKVASSIACSRPKKATISLPDIRSYPTRLLDTKPICRRTLSGDSTTSYPPIRAVPAVGARMVLRIRKTVVFPAPFKPSKPKICPGSARKERSSIATTEPLRRSGYSFRN